jgi:hypothetical protein
MILNHTYYRAIDYAQNICPPFATDIVHDAFVVWHDKYQTNLFDESESVVMEVVKKIYFNKYYPQYKKLVTIFKDHIQNNITPEDELIEKEGRIVFIGYHEIEARMNEYEKYHTVYPKINLN